MDWVADRQGAEGASGTVTAAARPAAGAGRGASTSLAWCAVGDTDAAGGPRRLELTATTGHENDPAALLGPAVPGPGLDALLLGSASVTALDLGLGDLGTGLDTEALRVTRRIGAHLDGAWAAELGLVVEAPLLDQVLADGSASLSTGPEAAMGAALARALEDGISPGAVDVSLLRDAAGPLEDLIATLPVWGDGLAPRLMFDPEVLQVARTAWRLLHATHQTWFAAHNRALGGNPRGVLQHPVDTWARQLAARASAVVERVHILRCLDGSGDDLRELVKMHFAHSAAADRDALADWLDGRINDPVETMLGIADPAATELAVLLEPLVPELEDEDDVADAVDAVGQYLQAWLLTDAGLLARLHRELHLATDAWAWRRVAVHGGSTAWSVADVPVAAHTTAAGLDVVDLLRHRE